MTRVSLILALFAAGCSSSAVTSSPTTDAAHDDSSASKDGATAETAAEDSIAPVDSFEPEDTATIDAPPPTDGAPSDGDPLGSGCNTVAQKGTAVSQTAWTDPIPALTGGVIADGTWVMTKWAKTEGTAPASVSTAETLVVAGTSWKIAAVAGSLSVHANGVATTSGNTITFVQTCPGSSSKASTYTATATELMVRDEPSHDLVWFTKL